MASLTLAPTALEQEAFSSSAPEKLARLSSTPPGAASSPIVSARRSCSTSRRSV